MEVDNFGQRVNLFKNGGNKYHNTGRGGTDQNGQLRDVVRRACDLQKRGQKFFLKSINLLI